jgi:hypothetical protein
VPPGKANVFFFRTAEMYAPKEKLIFEPYIKQMTSVSHRRLKII